MEGLSCYAYLFSSYSLHSLTTLSPIKMRIIVLLVYKSLLQGYDFLYAKS